MCTVHLHRDFTNRLLHIVWGKKLSPDIDHLRQWVGRSEVSTDQVGTFAAAGLAATLNAGHRQLRAGAPLPPTWHWLYFLQAHPQSELDADGHPRRGGFLPPVSLPRRMWAGSRLEFHHPLRLGDHIERTSQIADVTHKQGQSGSLVFLKVRHSISNAAGLAISEEQDIVYRDSPVPGTPLPAARPAPEHATWEERVHPTETLLFRYSALTFNSHRIHYDRPYATRVEGYAGLVVQGPLVATMLLELVARRRPDAQVLAFSFRAIRPLLDSADFALCGTPSADGKSVRLWTRDADGWMTMEAEATLCEPLPEQMK